MFKCVDCNLESLDSKEWYADLTENGKIMRCNSCGKKEEDLRWKNRFGDRQKPEWNKQDAIQQAKDLRSCNLSPWKYRKV